MFPHRSVSFPEAAAAGRAPPTHNDPFPIPQAVHLSLLRAHQMELHFSFLIFLFCGIIFRDGRFVHSAVAGVRYGARRVVAAGESRGRCSVPRISFAQPPVPAASPGFPRSRPRFRLCLQNGILSPSLAAGLQSDTRREPGQREA